MQQCVYLFNDSVLFDLILLNKMSSQLPLQPTLLQHQIDQYFEIQPFDDEAEINNYLNEVIHLQPYKSNTSRSNKPTINFPYSININNIQYNFIQNMDGSANNLNLAHQDNKTYKQCQKQRKYNVNKVIKCNYCNKMYSTVSSLQFHVKNKHQEKPFQTNRNLPPIKKQITENIPQKQQKINTKKNSCLLSPDNESQLQLTSEDAKYKDIVKIQYNECYAIQSTINLTFNLRIPNLKPELQMNNIKKAKNQSQNSKKKNRPFMNKRIYMCGSCLQFFHLNEQLTIHLRAEHKFEIPDGTIFGIKRQGLFNYFKIPFKKQGIQWTKQTQLFHCGCGKTYKCSSSLVFHINSVHNGHNLPGAGNGTPQKSNNI